ncbi:DoxX family protein [Halolamina salifodinae]|uniref:Putative membrane protein YphA (DoxX/SURF4 family) n=1 Tax=Halolamina salifodinae TaxID=1202767 RepID=A0A8T4H0E7_9EURY|nr:DoxX family protein [Halolamina salifodinae]MBP1987065.1 putative membrane protein YphA (DoxX/SURF4 family) [Halolamina salifodinae]
MSDTETTDGRAPSLLGRLLFASGLAALAVLNLTNLEGRIAYADAKGVPLADRLVPASSGLLLGGSLGIASWTLPKLSAGAVGAFFAGVTPLMHDFWAVDEDSRGEELTSFLQNLTLLGAAVAFFRRASGK